MGEVGVAREGFLDTAQGDVVVGVESLSGGSLAIVEGLREVSLRFY